MKQKCPDCNHEMDYIISNVKAPNDYRIRMYNCIFCTKKNDRTKTIAIIRREVPESKYWELVRVYIFETL